MPYKSKREQKQYHREYRKKNKEKIRNINNKSTLTRALKLMDADESITAAEKEIVKMVLSKAIENLDKKIKGGRRWTLF